MRKNHPFLGLLLFTFFIGTEAYAQEDPQYTQHQYTQYMYNMNVVNPAYAGSKETFSITALFRDQYSGLQGSPRTFTLSGHSPIGNNIGLGFSAINNEIGPVEETYAYADVSYTIDFDNDHHLAIGVKAGANFQNVDSFPMKLFGSTFTAFDTAFKENESESFFNLGAGLFYYTDNWYVSLSAPNFLNTTYLDIDQQEFGSDEQQFFATVGYVFQLNKNVKFKPSVFVKSELDSIVSYDVNTNFLLYERFEIGASYRVEDAFSGLVGYRPADWVQLGFAYDSSVSNFDEPSYEAFVTFNLLFNKTYLSPRYF